MDEEAVRELRSLRARAYGPDADIHRDPPAMIRLAQLEDRSRAAEAARAPAGELHEDPASVPADAWALPSASVPQEGGVDEGPEAEESGEPAAAPEEPSVAERPGRSPKSRRWMPVLWAASLVAVCILTAVATVTSMRLVSRDADAQQVATLQIDPVFDWPEYFGPSVEDGRGYQDFYGLRTMAGTPDWGGGSRGSCLMVTRDDAIEADTSSIAGEVFTGCAAGAFPATAELIVTVDMPEALRERFPDGAALQFVLDGDRVGVFSDAE